jgi:hypothetical protein
MTPDSELLGRYARTRSEDAFAELVRRHVSLVYSAALRQVNGDAHLGQDVAQTVFTDLARKAGSLARRESLAGWLYTSAHYAAAKIARTEDRRRDREDKFMREPIHETAPGSDWEKIRPALAVISLTHSSLFFRRQQVNLGKILGDAIGIARGQLPFHNFRVRANEKIRERDFRRQAAARSAPRNGIATVRFAANSRSSSRNVQYSQLPI